MLCRFQMKEDALEVEAKQAEGDAIDPAQARKHEITLAFFNECVADAKNVFSAADGDEVKQKPAADIPLALEIVQSLVKLMDVARGGNQLLDIQLCRFWRDLLVR